MSVWAQIFFTHFTQNNISQNRLSVEVLNGQSPGYPARIWWSWTACTSRATMLLLDDSEKSFIIFPGTRSSFCLKKKMSIQFSLSVMSDSLRSHELQPTRLPCPSPIPGAYSNSCPSSWIWVKKKCKWVLTCLWGHRHIHTHTHTHTHTHRPWNAPR